MSLKFDLELGSVNGKQEERLARSPTQIVPLLAEYFAGRPVRILEIGVFKAGLTRAFADSDLNIVQYDGVDPYGMLDDDPYLGAYWNSKGEAEKLYRNAQQVFDSLGFNLHRKTSRQFCHDLSRDTFYDIIYVDGDHSYSQALWDLCAFCRHLENDGIFLADDYANVDTRDVTRAVNDFVRIWKTNLESGGYLNNSFINANKFVPINQTTVYFKAKRREERIEIPVPDDFGGSLDRFYAVLFMAESVEAKLQLLHETGVRNVAIFGAGAFAEWLQRSIKSMGMLCVKAVLAEQADENRALWGLSVSDVQSFDYGSVDAVILATDCWQENMRKICEKAVPKHVKIVDLFEGMPAGPYPKI